MTWWKKSCLAKSTYTTFLAPGYWGKNDGEKKKEDHKDGHRKDNLLEKKG